MNLPDARQLSHLFNGRVSPETLASQETGGVYARIGRELVNYQAHQPLKPQSAAAAAIIAHSQAHYHAPLPLQEPSRRTPRVIDTLE